MDIKERKILLVDDEENILKLVEKTLKSFGFSNIFLARSKSEAMDIFYSNDIEMAVLDIILPDATGFDIIKEIRKTSNIPVLFLSAISDIEKQYDGFSLGADDYIVKPFDSKELFFRISAILNRSYPSFENVKLDFCQIDFQRALIIRDGKEVQLTAKEFNILKLLYENKNNIVTIDTILSRVWGDEYFGYENTLMAHISKIRSKIEKDSSKPKNLITIKGLGYKLKV